MSTSSAEVELPLADGRKAWLNRQAVLEAARASLATQVDDANRALVEIEGSSYDALALVALALGEPPDLIRALPALRALDELRLTLSGFQRAVKREPTASSVPYEEDPEPTQEEPHVDVSPALARRMQRKRGRWVAIRNGELVADDPVLHELLNAVKGSEVTVLFIPPKDV